MPSAMGQPVTTADIARELGVSQTTVSVVLGGHARKRRISPKTAARVLAAVKKLNYVPNHTARSLRLQRSGMVGVVVSNFSWGWTEAVMKGMLEVFRPSGHTPFVAIHEFDHELAERELRSCLERRDDAVICMPVPGISDAYRRIQQAGIPLIFLGDHPQDVNSASFVGWDAGPAARLAVEHLVETGRKRIGLVGVDYPMQMNLARVKAYHDVLSESGLRCNEDWIAINAIGGPPERTAIETLDRMFAPGREHPDAIFAVNDAMAVSLLEAFGNRGIRVPDDVALVGLGNLPLTECRGINLSTVEEPCAEMGRQVARVMLELEANPASGPIHRPIPGRDLKVRGTTGR